MIDQAPPRAEMGTPPGMRTSQLAAIILASALVTLDGTATTIALAAVGRDLSVAILRLQWIVNAPLLALASLLLPAGLVADRYGRLRVMRLGLLLFVAASFSCAMVGSDVALIAAKCGQGVGAAFVLPAALAALRSAYDDAAERTRIFGVWAAWTGAASAIGPLLAGALIDLWSWRAVFLPTALAGSVAILILGRDPSCDPPARREPVPVVAILALAVVLGGIAFLLTYGLAAPRAGTLAIPIGCAITGAGVLRRNRHRHVLFPPELISARNCLPANAATFALYFGMFGLSFLIVLYVQQQLRYSALWAAVTLLPMSIMLCFAERFGRLTSLLGTRTVIVTGTLVASGAIAWLASSGHPLPWWHLIMGTGLFGLGTSLAVSALTHAAVAAVPEPCAGSASALNHAVVRAAGLGAVALLGSIAAPGASDAVSAAGVRQALMLCAAVVAVGGLAGSALLRDEDPGGVTGA